jgi:hypothetical protein
MRPHELVFHGFLSEGELCNEVPFKRNEYAVNEGRVPRCRGLVNYKVTDHGGDVIGLRSQNFVAIILR